ACVRRVEDALLERPGVESASLDLRSRTLAISYDPTQLDADAIEAVVVTLGYTATRNARGQDDYQSEPAPDDLPIAFRRCWLAWILTVPILLLVVLQAITPMRHGA